MPPSYFDWWEDSQASIKGIQYGDYMDMCEFIGREMRKVYDDSRAYDPNVRLGRQNHLSYYLHPGSDGTA